jgi:hypothetical protein
VKHKSHTRAKAAKRKAKAAAAVKARAPIARLKRGTLGASVGFIVQQDTKTGSTPGNLGSLFAILAFALAIACFATALVPATAVPWRPVAMFISQRQLDLTLAGLALLVAAFWVVIMKGF